VTAERGPGEVVDTDLPGPDPFLVLVARSGAAGGGERARR
jgi:hypothetical protein